jgi:predicted MPP superfamily phosphohydrolase
MFLFMLTFFTIYGGTHAYVFLKTKAALQFGLRAGVPLGAFMLAMVLAPVIVRVAENQGLELTARVMSYVGYVWLGLLFMFFSASLAVDAVRGVLYLAGLAARSDLLALMPSARAVFFSVLAYSLVASGYGYFEARNIRVERLRIESPKLKEDMKIVQISDVHLGLVVRGERLAMILDKVRAEEPDVLVSTGDLVDGQINSLPGLAETLDGIRPRYGKYAVTGNHEFYAGLRQALAFTERAGFRVLRGEAVAVGGAVNIAGVDDHADNRFRDSKTVPEAEVLSDLPRDRFTVLLKHRPLAEKGSQGLFDLQLSGHTHSGQLFPFRWLTRLFYPYVSGLHGLPGGSKIYISRGSGTWGPPVRFLSPPEVTVIELLRPVDTAPG